MNLRERANELVKEAIRQDKAVRVFDPRYVTVGIPEVHEDHLYFPAGSYEFLGNYIEAPRNLLPEAKALAITAIEFMELCHKES